MRQLRHLTPRYIVDRTAVALWQHRNPQAPWLTAGAVAILGEWITIGDTIFEWGSGKSTLWFAEHAGHVISVEHDPGWYETVGLQVKIDRRTSAAVERYLVETVDGIRDTRSEEYIDVISRVNDETVDLVLVDGLHRDECAVRAVPKVRPGGMLVLDNADWYVTTNSRTPASKQNARRSSEAWERFHRTVSSWRRIVTTNGVWDTVIWLRPPT